MNPTTAARHPRRRRSIAVGAFLLVAGAFPAARSVRADFPLPLPHEIHREVRAHVHDALRSIGRIPAEIHRQHLRHLEVFLGGNVYYAPHRHHHATYNFPVSIDGGVHYRPYTYCNGRLYGRYASRPQFWMGWGVPSQGHWCSSHRSYYPTAHSCFHRPSRTYGSYGYESHTYGYRSESYGHSGRGYRSAPSYGSEGRYRGERGGKHHRHDRSCRHDRRDRH